jgi:hypothetical protein
MPETQSANPPTFESVMAGFQESRKEMQEYREQSEKKMQEYREKWQEEMKEIRELQKETDLIVKANAKLIGKFGNRFGEMVEHMVVPDLQEKFREYGLNFNETMSARVFSDGNKKVLFEVDIFLQNGDKAMLVEVKTTLTTEDVKDHIARLEKMRNYADLRGDKRAFLGAVAGVVMTSNVKEYALGQGFYVLEPSGETFNITPPGGEPKEW